MSWSLQPFFNDEEVDLHAIHALTDTKLIVIPLTAWIKYKYMFIVTIGNGSRPHQITEKIDLSEPTSCSPQSCSITYNKETEDVYFFTDDFEIYKLNLTEKKIKLIYTYTAPLNKRWTIHQLLMIKGKINVFISDIIDDHHYVYHYKLNEEDPNCRTPLELIKESKAIDNIIPTIPDYPGLWCSGFDLMVNRSTLLVPQKDDIFIINQYTLTTLKVSKDGTTDIVSCTNDVCEISGWNGIAITRDQTLLILEHITHERAGAFINIVDLKQVIKGGIPPNRCFRTQRIRIPSDQTVKQYQAIILEDLKREELIVSGFIKANCPNYVVPLALIKLICSSFSRETLCIITQCSAYTPMYCCTLSVDDLLEYPYKNLKMQLKELKH